MIYLQPPLMLDSANPAVHALAICSEGGNETSAASANDCPTPRHRDGYLPVCIVTATGKLHYGWGLNLPWEILPLPLGGVLIGIGLSLLTKTILFAERLSAYSACRYFSKSKLDRDNVELVRHALPRFII
jgi:hypothetical protein